MVVRRWEDYKVKAILAIGKTLAEVCVYFLSIVNEALDSSTAQSKE